MRAWTHRQYLVTVAWLEEQWQHPDRSDHYLMQIACEVRRVLASQPGKIMPSDFQIKFEEPKLIPRVKRQRLVGEDLGPQPPGRLTKEQIDKVNQAMTIARLKGLVK